MKVFRRLAGFSLMELSVSLVIIALVVGMTANLGLNSLESVKRASTNSKLDVIENALMAYRLAYNRLPCPADPTVTSSTPASYGYEAGSAGACSGGSIRVDSTNNVAEGAVPFRTLGLPEQMMYDGWGRKYVYAVNYNVTASAAMKGQWSADMCNISITDASDTSGARTSGALYTLISFGSDGHGGYLKTGTRLNAGANNAGELTNCHCDNTATNTTYSATYVIKDRTDDSNAPASNSGFFDDLGRFRERWQMMTPDDALSSTGPVCKYGFRIDGTIASGTLGVTARSSNIAGATVISADVNGDGVPDLVISGTDGGTNGKIYVIFGSRTGITSNPFLLSSLNGSNGFIATYTNSGSTYAPTLIKGDFNHDGYDDIFVNGANGGTDHGAIIYGQANWPASFTINSLTNATNPRGTLITGLSGFDYRSVAVGDINGDGYDDLVIGSGQSNSIMGQVFVIFGSASPASSVAVGTLNGTNGFNITGNHTKENLGWAVAVGDFNGDGYKDIIAGGPYFVGGPLSYGVTIWGHSSAYSWPATISEGSLASDGSQGFEINRGGNAVWSSGGGSTGYFGYTVAAGDINGDTRDDMIFGSLGGLVWGAGSGTLHAIFGQPSTNWHSNTFDINNINGITGEEFDGTYVGTSTANIGGGPILLGDFNGDGIVDILALTRNANAKSIFFGQATRWVNPINTLNLTGSNGFIFTGASASDYSAVGMINGCCYSDFIISDYAASPNSLANAGAVYVIKGQSAAMPSSISTSTISNYGYELDGPVAGGKAGYAMTTLDWNKDGIADLAIAEPYNSPNSVSNAGSVYVLYGRVKGWTTPFLLSNLDH